MAKFHFLNSAALALACALSLAACGKKDASTAAADDPLPLTNGPQSAIVAAPDLQALPAAPRPKIVARAQPEGDDYSYVDRAYAMNDAIGDAPPDYGFDYRDSHPWVWRSTDRSTRLVEPVSGGYRDYYYQPGADRPYLVRDPQYTYGFSNGELVAVYDRNGRLLPYHDLDQRDDDAGRILARAVALYDAAMQSERRAVNAANWAAQQAALADERAQWQAEQNQQDSWRAYHAAHAAQDQDDWKAERARRNQSAQSFNDWRARGYSGPPPSVSYGNRGNDRQQSEAVRVQQGQIEQARMLQQQADQARAQKQQADQARQQQDAARQAQDKARQQQQQDQARAQQQKAYQSRQQQDAARRAQGKARQQQQQDQARAQQQKADQARAQQQQADQTRQQQDAARRAQGKARQQQQQDQARAQQQKADQARAQQQQADQTRQQQDAARRAQGKARQQQQQDQARAQQSQGRGPGGRRAKEASSPQIIPPVPAALVSKPAPVGTPAPQVAATPAGGPPTGALPGDRRAQEEARRVARKKLSDAAQARDGKPPQP